MTLTKLFSVSLLLGGATFAPAAVQGDSPLELLQRSMEKASRTPVNAIVFQRNFGGFRCNAQMKIDQARDGRVRITMLQPLPMQGVTSVDDGRTWRTYFPDDRRLLIQESPRAAQLDPKDRMQLAARNYNFRLEDGDVVAGRSTISVVATPVSSELPVRRYTLDREHTFMLRLETLDGSRATTLMDTKSINFPSNVSSSNFEIRPIGEYRTIRLDPPEPIRSSRAVRDQLGFRPVFPEELPFGFVISDRRLVTSEDKAPVVALRVTDGLIMATVYQWNARLEDQPWPKGKKDREVDGIRFRMVGDLPDGVMSKVLEAFLRKAVKNMGQALETIQANLALPDSDSKNTIIVIFIRA